MKELNLKNFNLDQKKAIIERQNLKEMTCSNLEDYFRLKTLKIKPNDTSISSSKSFTAIEITWCLLSVVAFILLSLWGF